MHIIQNENQSNQCGMLWLRYYRAEPEASMNVLITNDAYFYNIAEIEGVSADIQEERGTPDPLISTAVHK